MSNNTLLETINPHPRDANILFDEPSHVYTILGDSGTSYKSVTTFVHSLFPEFDADTIIAKMMSSPFWTKNKYYGKTVDEIKMDWERNRDESAQQGTDMHAMIEDFYNSACDVSVLDMSKKETQHFLSFRKDFESTFGKDIRPYRSEWRVYEEDWKLAGSIDMVFETADKSLIIVDWKRCKNITRDSYSDEKALSKHINHLPNTNFWHYSLQLNVYKTILERKYEKKVTNLILINLHPNNAMNDYEWFDVDILPETLISNLVYDSNLYHPDPNKT